MSFVLINCEFTRILDLFKINVNFSDGICVSDFINIIKISEIIIPFIFHATSMNV